MWLVWKQSRHRHQNLQSGAIILSTIYHGMICKLSPGILKVSAAQSLRGCSMLSSCSARKSECYIHRHKHALLDVHFESEDSCPSAWILMMGDYVSTSENERVYQVKVVRWSEGQNHKCSRKYSVYSYSHTVDMWPKGSKVTEVGRDLKREVHTQKF